MSQDAQLSFADRVVADLERQLAEPDPRYAAKCRELAMLRAQYAELVEFVRSKKDVLGLVEAGPDGQPLPDQQSPASSQEAPQEPSSNGKAPVKTAS